MKKPFDMNAPYQPASFAFADMDKVQAILSRYPVGREQSAIMPLLDLAQRQVAAEGITLSPPVGGWIPRMAMDEIARICGVPAIKVYEVATFYSMYNLAPVGKYLVQFCTTTPCWLCGSDKIVKAAEAHLGVKMGDTTPDNLFTLVEVECLGACVNGPMVQINDDYFEDLTPDSIVKLLDDLKENRPVNAGSQTGRQGSQAQAGPTSLRDRAPKTAKA